MVKELQKNNKFANSFYYALMGLGWAVAKERNMQIHLLFVIGVVMSSIILGVTLGEVIALSIVITLVLVTEMLNTALEKLVDLTTGDQYHPLAKVVKDVAAGAVLLAALNSIIVGLIIFLPKLF